MQLWFIVSLSLASLSVNAQNCPRLEGIFRCRAVPSFEVRVKNQFTSAYTIYEMTDATGVRTILTDGKPHEMKFSTGMGSYRAQCAGPHLAVEGQSPEGEAFTDQYYIDRAALVRLRIGKKSGVSVLSCAPIEGTWNLYPH